MDISSKTIQRLQLHNKRVFVRVDFNVPLKNGRVADDTRITKSYRTIDYILKNGGMPILASHFQRPRGTGFEPDKSLKPVFEHLRTRYSGIRFAPSCIGDDTLKMAQNMKTGDILLLENLRFFHQEQENCPEFSRDLAKLADIYINDAFGSSHRAHASIFGITDHIRAKAFGFLMQDEIENLSRLITNPVSPYIAVMGGAKLSSKLAVLENLLKRVDKCIIGGGVSYAFLKVKGHAIGQSIFEEETKEACEFYLKEYGDRLILPVDRLCGNSFSNDTDWTTCDLDIPDSKLGLDIGPKTIKLFSENIRGAKTIFFNGPMGVFEFDNFSRGTIEVAKAIGHSGAFTVVGGGESIQAVKLAGVENDINYISTGGGASLEFLGGVILPGIQAILS